MDKAHTYRTMNMYAQLDWLCNLDLMKSVK